MTTNEIITELVSYNLGTYKQKELRSSGFEKEVDANGREYWIRGEDYSAYLTDLNILHRVAVKVMHELIDSPCHDDISDLTDRYLNIHFTMTKLPINGEYITLATATAEAIVYLSKHKV